MSTPSTEQLIRTFRLATPSSKPTTARIYQGPYHNAFYAVELKPALIALKQSAPEGITISLSDTMRSVKTLENKIRQAWDYIIKYDDPEGEWLSLRRATKLVYVENGIAIQYRPQKHRQSYTTPEQAGWQSHLVTFLENGEGKWERHGLAFTPLEISWINRLLRPMMSTLTYEIMKDGLLVQFRV